ncbi:MAG TPA: hypothetical protein VN256_06885 [Pyrinomonadaceae bacterium]|nr:hypothetical protein [Pyrinomonadaceae bacterium]
MFIAIGGSGTKVAESLVRLLAVGFPTGSSQDGSLSSVEETLHIWRVDTDRNAGAADTLKDTLREYRDLQGYLSSSEVRQAGASRWSMAVDLDVRDLNPTELPAAAEGDNQTKTLAGILDSSYGGVQKSLPLLQPFFNANDLKVEVDRGFYQKPFIGAAVMALFAKSLEAQNSPAGRIASLKDFEGQPTRFFLCGSLHGGTGACGVPVMGGLLHRLQVSHQDWDWRLGACLLSPYFVPPDPPFDPLEEHEQLPDEELRERIESLVQLHGNKAAFSGMGLPEKRQLVWQILHRFYANRDEMVARARQGLMYYRDYSADYFDELYLVGKPNPSQLREWSNGGSNQRNPLNVAEVVAALAALNFFSHREPRKTEDAYLIASAESDIQTETVRLAQLPTYKVGDQEINPEAVLLATALLPQLILREFPWDRVREAAGKFKLAELYDKTGAFAAAPGERHNFEEALSLIERFILSIVEPETPERPSGWSADDQSELRVLLTSDQVGENFKEKFWGSSARGVNTLGRTSVAFTAKEFGQWFPPGNAHLTRGDYLRFVWNQIYSRCRRGRA